MGTNMYATDILIKVTRWCCQHGLVQSGMLCKALVRLAGRCSLRCVAAPLQPGCVCVMVVLVQTNRLLEARGWCQKGGTYRRPWTSALPAVTQLLKQWHRQWTLVVHVSVSQACLSAGTPDSSG